LKIKGFDVKMIFQKKLLFLTLLVIGVILLQPVSAPETTTTSVLLVPTSSGVSFISGSAYPLSGLAPLTVQFTDSSTYILTSWDWDFGDGIHSYIKNPNHTYIIPGKYQVKLKQRNSYANPTKIAIITVASPDPIFITNITATIRCPLVYFNGTSTGDPTSWLWNFGDGTTSTEQNPIHAYSINGSYTVNLTVTSNQSGSNSVSKQISLDCVIPVSDVTVTTWTKDGEYTVAGAYVYLDREEGRLLGKTGMDGSLRVSVPSDTSSLYARSPVYKDSYFFEGLFTTANKQEIIDLSPTLSPVSILLDQKVSDFYILTDADNNAIVSMKKGSIIRLKLGENGGSTGYLWELSTTPGLKVTDNSFVLSDVCDGCGGTRIWEMTADSIGQQQIVAVSKRSWEPITGHEKTFRLTINVT
jgi:PKD repeat protein